MCSKSISFLNALLRLPFLKVHKSCGLNDCKKPLIQDLFETTTAPCTVSHLSSGADVLDTVSSPSRLLTKIFLIPELSPPLAERYICCHLGLIVLGLLIFSEWPANHALAKIVTVVFIIPNFHDYYSIQLFAFHHSF